MLDPAATGSMVEVEPRYQGPAGPGAPDLGLSNDTNPAIDAVPPLEKPGLIRVNTWERPLTPSARSIPMLNNAPWVRSLGAIDFSIQTQGWRFPLPPDLNLRKSRQACPASNTEEVEPAPDEPEAQPTQEMIDFATAAGENPVVGTQEAVLGLPVGGTALLPPGAEGEKVSMWATPSPA